MARQKQYVVEVKSDLGWSGLLETRTRGRQYCLGFVAAFDSMYPSKPMRIKDLETGEIIKETTGRGDVNV